MRQYFFIKQCVKDCTLSISGIQVLKIIFCFSFLLPFTYAIAQLPIVYRPEYDFQLQFEGIDFRNLSHFTMKSYRSIFELLQIDGLFLEDEWFIPEKVTSDELERAHTAAYLDELSDLTRFLRVFEIGDDLGRDADYQKKFVKYKKSIVQNIRSAQEFGTGGTVLAADLALERGWAINISGGYHHAHNNMGSGFCLFADGPIAIKRFLVKQPKAHVLIVDLDAHLGDGNVEIFQNEKRVHIFDIYNEENFPLQGDKRLEDFVGNRKNRGKLFLYGVGAYKKTSEQKYLALLNQTLPKALDAVKPSLIYYNAGTDVYKNDPLGRMLISAEGIFERDRIVFSHAKSRNIPIFMTTSGGYHSDVPEIVAHSISNLVRIMDSSVEFEGNDKAHPLRSKRKPKKHNHGENDSPYKRKYK